MTETVKLTEADKSDMARLETTAEERAEVCRNLERGDWTGLKLAAMHRDFDRLTAAIASERERAEKAERALAREREIPGVSMEPHDDAELTARIVRCAYGWQVDPAGRLYGLVAGDMGYTATHIVLGEEDRWGKGDAKWAFEDRKKIEAERDAFAKRVTELEGALTPSVETKAAYSGEFRFSFRAGVDEHGDDLVYDGVQVPWTTIKEIMAAIRDRAVLKKENADG